MWVRAMVVGSLLVAALARAGGAEELDEAARLVRELHEEEAVQVLTRALDRPDLTAQQRADAYALLGLVRLNLHDEEGARLAFRRALDAQREVALPKTASPRTRAVFAEARAAWDKEQATAVSPPPPPPPPPLVEQPAGPSLVRPAVGIGVGVVGVGLAVVGGVFIAQARSQYELARAAPDARSAEQRYRDAVSGNTLGVSLAIAGGAALATGVVLTLWPAQKTAVTLVITPTSLGVAGRF